MTVFAVIGWLLLLALDLALTWQGFGVIVLSKGFTGKVHWLGIVIVLAGIAGAIGLLRFAPFHVSVS